MKKLMAIVVTVVLLLAMVVAVPVAAQSDHQGLKGCQVDPNGVTYTVDVGFILDLPFPLVEELGACCIRGDWNSSQSNGFPGGCCKHPWIVPGRPPTSNPPPQPPNLHPGERANPTEVPQVAGVGLQHPGRLGRARLLVTGTGTVILICWWGQVTVKSGSTRAYLSRQRWYFWRRELAWGCGENAALNSHFLPSFSF